MAESDWVVLVAHGRKLENAPTNKRVKIITKLDNCLTFAEAKEYFESGTKPEIPSPAVRACSPLSDESYIALFGQAPPETNNTYVFTGKRVSNNMTGKKVYALRGNKVVALSAIERWARNTLGCGLVLLVCRETRD